MFTQEPPLFTLELRPLHPRLFRSFSSCSYFFKKACDEFETGVVKEEINNDDEVLPLWEGKVVAKVERMD